MGKKRTTLADNPYYQGSLDGLCAIYACVNCIRLLLDGKVNSKELFDNIVRKLRKKISGFILDGVTPTELEQDILRLCVGYLSKQDVSLQYKPMTSTKLNDYWSIMQNHYETHGEGSIILSVSGTYEHWTCVRHITPRCITLANSNNLSRLYRSRVTVGSPTKQRIHALLPKETFLLSID